jgi:hypothetical protein
VDGMFVARHAYYVIERLGVERDDICDIICDLMTFGARFTRRRRRALDCIVRRDATRRGATNATNAT